MALEKAEGFKEEGQLKYKIALSESSGNNPSEGIVLFKEVAANENYTPTIRAYAVQNLGSLLYSYNTPEVKTEVFKDDPYKSFWLEDDYSLSRRKVFDYASSLYPLGISELRIAKWYTEEILESINSKNIDASPEKSIEEMKLIVREKLINTDKYLRDIAKDEQARSYIAEVLYRKGMVLGDMLLVGDTTFADPEDVFKQSLSVAAVGNIKLEASAKYTYAVFLAKMYGEKRADDIKKLLGDFYQKDVYKNTTIVRFIKNEKNNGLGQKSDIILLAKIDAKFHDFLLSLGWTVD